MRMLICIREHVESIKNTALKNVPHSLLLKVNKVKTIKPIRVPLNSTDVITYKSSNRKVATASSGGKIIGKKKGTVKITVTCGKGTAICVVKVE